MASQQIVRFMESGYFNIFLIWRQYGNQTLNLPCPAFRKSCDLQYMYCPIHVCRCAIQIKPVHRTGGSVEADIKYTTYVSEPHTLTSTTTLPHSHEWRFTTIHYLCDNETTLKVYLLPSANQENAGFKTPWIELHKARIAFLLRRSNHPKVPTPCYPSNVLLPDPTTSSLDRLPKPMVSIRHWMLIGRYVRSTGRESYVDKGCAAIRQTRNLFALHIKLVNIYDVAQWLWLQAFDAPLTSWFWFRNFIVAFLFIFRLVLCGLHSPCPTTRFLM